MTREEIQQEALNVLLNNKRAGIAVSMGVGKTLIGLLHMKEYYSDTSRFLVVAPKRTIFKSWLDEADKHGLTYLKEHIVFTTYLSLNKQDADYDVVYLDECHNLLYSHEDFLDSYKGSIVGLTGTAPRISDSEKGEMVDGYCPIKYKYITDQAVEHGILNDYQIMIHYIKLGTTNNYMVKGKNKSFPTSELANYNYWSERLLNTESQKELQILRVMRMKALMSYPSKEKYAKELFNFIEDKCILFANTQEQADKLCTHSYHSNNKDSEVNLDKFKSGEITKLSCVLQLSEGVNIPDLKQGIIMHAYGNERKATQRLGRMLRLNPYEKAIIHILCYEDTVDEAWVNQALKEYDSNKIVKVRKNA